MKASRLPVASFAIVALIGCGAEVGRVPFSAESTASSTMSLKAGDVSFWTDIDLTYEGDASLTYHVELSQGGTLVATATCNPLGHLATKSVWTETNVGGSHARRGSGKMDCSASLPKDGPTQVSAKLAFGTRPFKVKLTKADLVLRQ